MDVMVAVIMRDIRRNVRLPYHAKKVFGKNCMPTIIMPTSPELEEKLEG